MTRKTRKHKEKSSARRQVESSMGSSEGNHSGVVKREFEFSFTGLTQPAKPTIENKKSDNSFYFYQSASTARDLVKTVILATIIFSLEVMIYFALFKQAGIGYEIYKLINGQFINL
ncbi:MAG: hypothetical protein G01um10145_212 [Microgenomates group bacterium Gr01-1014_5]|nr:MAG: hypothetical protein G01um10145_212 [Microgenomates group bacterium Gr01-1014_5]